MSDAVLYSRDGAVAVLTLNNPARRNALVRETYVELIERLREINGDGELRAIVLRGAGRHFCSGGDISQMQKRSLLQYRERLELVSELIRLMATGSKPIVAAVEGACVGAGMSLAAIADYVVTGGNAKFGGVFVKIGLLPDLGGLWSVEQRVGRAKAREIFSLARNFHGGDAHAMGLANEVVADDEVQERALAVAREYAAMPPISMALLRSVLARGVDSLDDALRAEVDHQSLLLGTADHEEAVKAFMEKRSPSFTGS